MITEDAELRELEEIKANLLRRIYELRDETLRREQNAPRSQTVNVDKFAMFFNDSNAINDTINNDKRTNRLCNASQFILGVQFKDVEKNWLHECTYRYDAQVITKAVQFMVELTVDVKNINEYEIQDINCHFVNVDKSYMAEITPWIQRFTKNKHFSHLISAISDYSEQSVIRAKIFSAINKKGYITLGKCNEEGGGILIYVHPPKEADRIFFKFQWFTKFVDKNWRIEHIFAIDPVLADDEYVKAHSDLLQSFCRIGLRQADLEELWNNLCSIMDKEKT